MNKLKLVWQLLKGKKTYIVAFLSIALGAYAKNPELIMTGLIAFGIRDGLNTAITKLIVQQPLSTGTYIGNTQVNNPNSTLNS